MRLKQLNTTGTSFENKRLKTGRILGTVAADQSAEALRCGGLILATVPKFPAAQDVFTAAEMDSRIEAHSARLANAPLCGRVCWCCSKPKPRNIGIRVIGWVSREIRITPAVVAVETYCPECFSEWGWPDE
jgi:hypothetical protein